MPNAKMKIVNPEIVDEDGTPIVAEIIASSFPRWEAKGFEEYVPEGEDSSVKEPVDQHGEGEPTGEQKAADAQALVDATKSGADPAGAKAEGAQAGADTAPKPGGKQTP